MRFLVSSLFTRKGKNGEARAKNYYGLHPKVSVQTFKRGRKKRQANGLGRISNASNHDNKMVSDNLPIDHQSIDDLDDTEPKKEPNETDDDSDLEDNENSNDN